MQTTFEDYASEESDAIANGDKLVAPEMLRDRWRISQKELLKIVNDNHKSGIHLPALRFGSKTMRFSARRCRQSRIRDVRQRCGAVMVTWMATNL